MHYNCDIRLFTCQAPLGSTAKPHTPVTGKGSRITEYCGQIRTNLVSECKNKISSCGQNQFAQGRYHIFYAIHGIACCSECWNLIYYKQVEEE